MSDADHDELRVSLSAYVLGVLDDRDRRTIAQHLATCAACTEEAARLHDLTTRLATLTADDIAATIEPVPASTDRFVATALARQRTRHHTQRLWQAAAVAATILAVASFLGHPGTPTEPAGMALTPVATGAATGTAAPIAKPWGTEIHLTARQLPASTSYKLWTIDRSGHREIAATWAPSPTNTYRVTGATSTTPTDLARIQITTTDDQPLLTRDL